LSKLFLLANSSSISLCGVWEVLEALGGLVDNDTAQICQLK